MEGYRPETYGDAIADLYDDLYVAGGGILDLEGSVDRLAALAAGGRVLELAIGTGRIALPLAARGLEVHGVDASAAMVAKLRQKPGGDRIPVTIGDFADVPVDGRFDLVFVAFNTFFALLTQEDQLRCFENAAAHLTEGGVFAIEAFVPDLTRFDRDQRVAATTVELERAILEVSRHDRLAQRVDGHHLVLEAGGVRLIPLSLRYTFPSELDLMARLAGLRLRERHGDWLGEPFTARSMMHVSVYGR
jgi:SAM-dependent methyltransferase